MFPPTNVRDQGDKHPALLFQKILELAWESFSDVESFSDLERTDWSRNCTEDMASIIRSGLSKAVTCKGGL